MVTSGNMPEADILGTITRPKGIGTNVDASARCGPGALVLVLREPSQNLAHFASDVIELLALRESDCH